MKPTNKLRWLVKSGPHSQTVLQQWWEHTSIMDMKDGIWGEWRDVPIEVEK